jgi:hypothetical protein
MGRLRVFIVLLMPGSLLEGYALQTSRKASALRVALITHPHRECIEKSTGENFA